MNYYRLSLFGVFVAFCSPSLVAGQAFQNLDFETVQLSEAPDSGNLYGALVTLPGWTFHQRDNNQLNLAPHLGTTPQTVLVTDNFGFEDITHISPVQGHYSIYLQEGIYFPDLTQVGPAVSQTGLIPANTKTLLFRGPGGLLGGAESLWTVSINDVPVPVKRNVVGRFPDYLPLPNYPLVVAADVRAYAGTVATLRIALDPAHDLPIGPPFSHDTSGFLDDIRFSTLDYNFIPEPSTAVLLIVVLVMTSAVRQCGR